MPFEEVEIVPGVLLLWLVLHVLITLLCHLGQAGTPLGYSSVWCMVVPGCP